MELILGVGYLRVSPVKIRDLWARWQRWDTVHIAHL